MAVIDEDALSPPQYMHATVGAFPATAELARRCGLPLGIGIQPLAESPEVPDIAVVDHTRLGGVVRCTDCRAYINPFVNLLDSGMRWQCNICSALMPVSSAYFVPTDAAGNRKPDDPRQELRTGSVEYVATKEYVVRAPPPPTFVFIIDVSVQAASSGMIDVVASGIKASLDGLPGGDRTLVGFVTFDDFVHFHRFKPACPLPEVLTMPDLDDPFVPAPEDLIVNLAEHRGAVDALLDALPAMHRDARSADACLGAALDGAFQIMQHVGGKMLSFCATLPTIGTGKLRPREAPQQLGSATEHKLLSPDDDPRASGLYYRQKAGEFSRQHICIDTFFFSPRYTDIASIATISRFTAGQTFHYPAFTAATDGSRLHQDIVHDLTRTTGFEAVMRVRCSRGVRVVNFYGNFFIRGQDLLAMPVVSQDTAFNVELEHTNEPIPPGSLVTVQAALLFTNQSGQRRITVHTLSIPVTSRPHEVFENADAEALANMISKKALDVALRVGLHQSRLSVHQQVLDIVRGHHASTGADASAGAAPAASRGPAMSLPESLSLLPLYGLGLQKATVFRGGKDVRSDERAALCYRTLCQPVVCSTPIAYPRMYALHRLPEEACAPIDAEAEDKKAAELGDEYDPPATAGFDEVLLPPAEGLSASRLDRSGAYLLEDGVEGYVWVGADAPAELLTSLLGVPSLTGVDMSNLALPVIPASQLNQRVHTLLQALADTAPQLPRVRVVLQGSGQPIEARFHMRLVEDRLQVTGGAGSYGEYLAQLNREAVGGASAGAGAAAARHMQLSATGPPPTS
jgi:protein transport protein SEC24